MRILTLQQCIQRLPRTLAAIVQKSLYGSALPIFMAHLQPLRLARTIILLPQVIVVMCPMISHYVGSSVLSFPTCKASPPPSTASSASSCQCPMVFSSMTVPRKCSTYSVTLVLPCWYWLDLLWLSVRQQILSCLLHIPYGKHYHVLLLLLSLYPYPGPYSSSSLASSTT